MRTTRTSTALTILLPAFALACSSGTSEISEAANEQGSISVALGSASVDGTEYVLCEGTISIKGEGLDQQFDVTESLAQDTVVAESLPVGTYSVTLEDWTLCENVDSGLEPVDAVLVGESTVEVTVVAGNTVSMDFTLQLGRPSGDIAVGINVINAEDNAQDNNAQDNNAQGEEPTWTLVASKDTYVRTDLDIRRNDNYGCDFAFCVGTGRGGDGMPWGAADAMRAMIQFDLAAIPAPVAKALLRLRVVEDVRDASLEALVVSVHRIEPTPELTPWEEGNGAEATGYPKQCEHADPAHGVAWEGPPAGDQNNQPQPGSSDEVFASYGFPAAQVVKTGTVVDFDITALVNGWISGKYENYGLMLRALEASTAFKGIFFGAREGELFDYPDERRQPGPELLLFADEPNP